METEKESINDPCDIAQFLESYFADIISPKLSDQKCSPLEDFVIFKK